MYSDKSDKENDQEHDGVWQWGDGEEWGKRHRHVRRRDDSYIEPEPVEPLKETHLHWANHEELGEVTTCDVQGFTFCEVIDEIEDIYMTYCLFSKNSIHMYLF